MPVEHAEPVLPLVCPHCAHDQAKLFINSYTVVTVVCSECSHSWALETESLPQEVRVKIDAGSSHG